MAQGRWPPSCWRTPAPALHPAPPQRAARHDSLPSLVRLAQQACRCRLQQSCRWRQQSRAARAAAADDPGAARAGRCAQPPVRHSKGSLKAGNLARSLQICNQRPCRWTLRSIQHCLQTWGLQLGFRKIATGRRTARQHCLLVNTQTACSTVQQQARNRGARSARARKHVSSAQGPATLPPSHSTSMLCRARLPGRKPNAQEADSAPIAVPNVDPAESSPDPASTAGCDAPPAPAPLPGRSAARTLRGPAHRPPAAPAAPARRARATRAAPLLLHPAGPAAPPPC